MNSILDIQIEFNKQLISGISYHFLNNPVISWDNGFLQGLTALCALFALVNIFSKANNTQAFASELLSFGFYLALVFANFGVINPRDFFNLGLSGNYDYSSKETPPSSKELNISYSNTRVTLDREIYNAISMFANDLAASIRGSGNVTQAQIQTNALSSTVYFLKQVQLAKFNCVGYEKKSAQEYASCLGGFIPSVHPISTTGEVNETPCKDATTGSRIRCRNGDEEEDAQGGTEAEKSSGGLLNFATPDFMERIAKYITSAYTYTVLVLSEPLTTVVLPSLLALVEILRSAVGFVMLIGFGFAAAGTMFFAKFISPLIILPRFRGQVISAYKMVFATTLYGFVAELFLFFSTILTLGLRDACFNIVIPYMLKGQGQSGMEFAILSATLSIMVYIAVISVLVIQVYSLLKIPDACKHLMNLNVSAFVSMGEELAGVGAKLGMAVGAAAFAAPALIGGGAVLAAGGGAAGAIGSLAAGKGALGAIAAKTGAVGKFAVKGAQTATNVARKTGAVVSKYGGGAADFIYGKDAGDAVRKAVGGESYSGGGTSDTSTLPAKAKDGGDPKLKQAKAEAKGEKVESSSESSGATPSGFKAKSGGGESGGGGVAGGNSPGTMPNFKKASNLFGGGKATNSGEDRRPGFMRMVDKIPGAKFATRGIKTVFDTVNNNAGKMGLDKTLRTNGVGFENTVVGTLAKNAGKMSNKVEQSLINLEKDQASQEKFARFRNFVGANSAEDKAIAYNELKDTMDDRYSNQELDLETAAKFEEVKGRIESNQASDEDYQEAFKIARTKNFEDEQQKQGLESLLKNKAYQEYAKKKDFAYQTAMSQYMSGSDTIENTRKLNSLISQGAGSFTPTMNTTEFNEAASVIGGGGTLAAKDQERFDNQMKINAFTSETQSRLNRSVQQGLDPATKALKELRTNDDLTKSEKEAYQQKINQTVSNFVKNNALSSSVLGNQDFADLAAQNGTLSKDESTRYAKAGSRQKVISDMEQALNELEGDLNLSNGSSIRNMNNQGFGAFDVNDNQLEKIKLSDISDMQERSKMETLLNNIEIILGKHSSNAFRNADGSHMYSNEQIAKMAKIRDIFEK